jgi:hypothetical protein
MSKLYANGAKPPDFSGLPKRNFYGRIRFSERGKGLVWRT